MKCKTKKYTPKFTTTELLTRLDGQVKAIKTSEDYQEHLKIMSNFPTYRGTTNRLLIAMFAPNASCLAASGQWFKLGYIINKGESGIPLFRPQKWQKKDDDDVVIGSGLFFSIFYSFDISQVREMTPEQLIGFRENKKNILKDAPLNPQKHRDLFHFKTAEIDDMGWLPKIVKVIKGLNINVEWADNLSTGVYGYSTGGKVILKADESTLTQFRIAAHELGHELLHDPKARQMRTKSQKEFEAESFAFVLCEMLGLPQASANYLSGYGEYNLQDATKRVSKAIDSITQSLGLCDIPQPQQLQKAA